MTLIGLKVSQFTLSTTGSFPYWSESLSTVTQDVAQAIKLDVFQATMTWQEQVQLCMEGAYFAYTARCDEINWNLDGKSVDLEAICLPVTFEK